MGDVHRIGAAGRKGTVTTPESYRYVDLGNGRCRVASVSYFPTIEARDAIAAGGMESGAVESYELLDVLLAQLSKASK